MYVEFISSFDMDGHYRVDGVRYSVRVGMCDRITRADYRATVRALIGTVHNRDYPQTPVPPEVVAYFRTAMECPDLVGAHFAEDWTVVLDGPSPRVVPEDNGAILASWRDLVSGAVKRGA